MNWLVLETLCFAKVAGSPDVAALEAIQNNQAAKRRPDVLGTLQADQIVGFHADGIRRYLAPSFATWPIEGKVKWKPMTVAFSAAAKS
ncbi:hypothetical protein ACVIIV_004942 [Bradyrhizobium sp. USDA 4354]